MSHAVPDEWFWIMVVIALAGMVGLGYQLRRVERKINALWRFLASPDRSKG